MENYNDDIIRPREASPEEKEEKQAADAKEQSDVRMWLTRIEHSEKYRKHNADKYGWRRLLEDYRGEYSQLVNSTDIYVPIINLIYAFIKSEIPALYLHNPKIKVNPKKGSSVLAAKILEKALNYIWRAKKIKRENKKNIFDTMVTGHSWFKSGYTGKFGAVESNNDRWEFIDEEEFFGYRIDFDRVSFNPDSNDPPYDCTWIAHQVFVPLAEIKKDPAYQHTEKLTGAQIEPSSKKTEGSEADDRLRQDPTVAMVSLYEVWDKSSNQRFIVSKECGYYLKPPTEWPYDMKGFPFSFLRLNDDPRNPYGIPDCFMFESHVVELMKLLAQQLDHVKRFNRQLVGRKGALTDEAKAQFKQGVTGAYLEADISSNESINNVIAPIPYPPLQTDIYNIQAALKDYLVLISGKPYSEFGGKQDTSTRTIRELMEMQKGATDRRAEKIDSVEDFISDISMNYIALLQQFVDVPFYVKVTGEDPQVIMEALQQRPSAQMPGAVTSPDGFTFTKEDVIGEFDVEIVPGSTVPMDQARKIELILQGLQMAPTAGAMPGGPVIQLLSSQLADEMDLPELVDAMKQESKMAQEQQKKQAEQQAQAQQLQIGQSTAELQLKAEQQATKQNQLTMDFITSMREPKEKKADE